MRLHSKRTIRYGRMLIALLLICGILLPIGQQSHAASVTYQYEWITDVSGLPTDDQWHDYFIAWEDTDKKGTYWFTDYNWFTADGDSNIDVGGSSWLEYKSSSTLPNTTAKSFTSTQCLGHMQIKYVGKDKDNGNSPKYHIRLQQNNGIYQYVDRWNPDPEPDSADDFTFVDKGDVFHIFVNIADQADKYLTRDGDQLETSLSSSSSSDEYPLRVYKRSVDRSAMENSTDFDGNRNDLEGRITLYHYDRVNTVEELYAMTKDKSTWHDIFLAWEDVNGSGTQNPYTVWYTKGLWYDEDGDPNYEDVALAYEYYCDSYLGADGYSSSSADSFVMYEPVGHFQIRFESWNSSSGNVVDGVKDSEGKTYKSPEFYVRFSTGGNNYAYIERDDFVSSLDDAMPYVFQLRLDADRKNEKDYGYGSFWIFEDVPAYTDNMMTIRNNRLDRSAYNLSSYWEYPIRVYTRKPVEYDGIVKSFTIGKGSTYSVDKHLILQTGLTITVEDGGVLMVDSQLYNNGNIVVKEGGTLIVNEGGYIMPFGSLSLGGNIILEGGSMIIMDGAKVLCDENTGTLKMRDGATVVNRGLLLIRSGLDMNNNCLLRNEETGTLYLGGRLGLERGSVGEFSAQDIIGKVVGHICKNLIADNSKIVNSGEIKEFVLLGIKFVSWSYDGTSERIDIE